MLVHLGCHSITKTKLGSFNEHRTFAQDAPNGYKTSHLACETSGASKCLRCPKTSLLEPQSGTTFGAFIRYVRWGLLDYARSARNHWSRHGRTHPVHTGLLCASLKNWLSLGASRSIRCHIQWSTGHIRCLLNSSTDSTLNSFSSVPTLKCFAKHVRLELAFF
jgi:hypothetical protein